MWLVGQKLISKSFLLLVLAWYAPETMCFGLSIALEVGFLPILLEFDVFSVVNLVISKSPPYFEIGLFILDILNLLESPNVCEVSYSHRSTNMVVHSLAKFAFSFSYETLGSKTFHLL
ncbi:hypothetical protein ACOSQ2_007286 [Xanthoceras sorbifolium]